MPSTRIFLNPVYGGNIIQANVLGRSDAGTFTCSIPSVGNFSAQLAFIGIYVKCIIKVSSFSSVRGGGRACKVFHAK